MIIPSLIEQLEERLHTIRTYTPKEDITIAEIDLKRYVEYMKGLPNCSGSRPVIQKRQYQTTDLCLRGPGTQNELGQKWGLPLPEDYLLFCSRYREYLFAGRALVIINSPEAILDSVTAARDVVDMEATDPHRLFHFADILGLPGYFSFRWSQDLSAMDVVFVWDFGDVTTTHLLESHTERYRSDPDFTSWLSRMIATDGAPLFRHSRWPMAERRWFQDDYSYSNRMAKE